MRTILLSIITLCSLLVSACSPPMPARNPPSHDEMLDMIGSQWEERKPIRTIKLPSTFFLSRPLRGGLPEELSELPFNAYFPEGDATIDDIIALLDYQGLPVAFYWENTDAIDEIKARSINFRRYNGTLGGFLRKIEKTVDVAHWWDDDTLFLATTQRYVVTIPQEETTSSIIEDELSNLGASEIFRSVHGGQMIYSAPPRLNEEILVPFLRRISQNFCEVTMQIALVTVTITDTLNRGFDWNAFNMTINTKQDGRISDEDDEGSLTTISSQQIIHNLLRRGFPIFGSETEVGISMAIAYLSQFGRTKTAQAVELRTLAGQEITIDRSTEIPYVSGYEGGTTGDNPTPPTPEFDTVDVGLEVTLTPNFDSLTGITTLSM
ncbi:MAG: hypothetical protein U9N14_01830, partial [Pseudomonadota bacterium]|nr:hypothetical protein [Pseudomonadota bacterium]